MANHPANLADPVLLGKIDKFFDLGIGEYVALPQVRSNSAILSIMATDHRSATCGRGSVQVTSRRREGKIVPKADLPQVVKVRCFKD